MQEETAARMRKGIKREAESVQTPSDVSETVANAPGQSDLEQNPQIGNPIRRTDRRVERAYVVRLVEHLAGLRDEPDNFGRAVAD